MSALRRRLERLARKLPSPTRFLMTKEEQRAWCVRLGIALDSVVLGSPERGFVILPPKDED